MSSISSIGSIGMISPLTNISKDVVAKNDTNSDSSLSLEELGINQEQFSFLDSDSDGLVTQNEIATAIDNKLSQFNGEMPSKEEFQSLISDLGLVIAESPISKESSDFASLIMSNYDTDGDLSLSSSEVSLLSDEEFSTLDSNGDSSISSDELSSAYDKVSESSSSTKSEPPMGGGSMASSSEEEYDELDTNEDGIVSEKEKLAGLGINSDSSVSNETSKDTIKLLLDTIKLNSTNDSTDLDLSSFKNIMKMMNNETNNTNLNTYVNNLSTSNNSVFNYA